MQWKKILALIKLLLSDVTRDDEVIVPTLTFIAAVNPVKYIGAEPIFMDCDDTLCIDTKKVRQFCENECNFIDGNLINNIFKEIFQNGSLQQEDH